MDAASVAALLAELGYPDNTPGEVAERLGAWEEESNGTVLVAEMEGNGVGLAAWTAIPYLERAGRWGRLVALVVAGDIRSRGVARRLVAAAEQWARTRGCSAMELTSSRSREVAREFYRRLGYEDRCGRSARFAKLL